VPFLFPASSAFGQQKNKPASFRNGPWNVERNISGAAGAIIRKDSLRSVHFKGYYYVLLQFDKLPDSRVRKEMEGIGVKLFDYIPDRNFMAEVRDDFTPDELKKFGVGGLSGMPPFFKMARKLQQQPDAWAHEQGQWIGVRFFGSIAKEEVGNALKAAGATVVSTKIQPDHVVFIQAGGAVLQKIAALPFVSYLAPQSMKPQPLNYNNRATHGADALSAASGRNLRGDGVVLGMGDNSDPFTHVDFTGRLIERFASTVNTHGTHTSGTAGGGGILDPRYQGMAPHATIVSQYFSDILVNSPTYIQDYDMVLTNNSYTDYDPGCGFEGEYDFLSNYTDAQLYQYPTLLHNFAAGNDGQFVCSPFPLQFGTVKSGFQCAKNVLTVGNLDNSSYIISYASSAGPVNDGRLKPEIVAGGTNIISTFPYNTYAPNSGTSMSSPTVTGSLALLVQRYRQMHGGLDPTAALIKTLACNSATDLGNPGPDYLYGFGSLNILAAAQAMENNQYFAGTVNNAGAQTYNLTIPAGLQQVKIMLYWPDYPATPDAATALVNNLDLTVTSPDATIHYPLILNPDPVHVNDNAVEGVDNLNNIEQVVINNPPAGNFSISVAGTSIPTGSQHFTVAYQIIAPSVTIEYPFGNETWVPGQPETIRWSAYGGDPNSFTVEYSPDNGLSWSTINNAVPSASRMLAWITPAAATNQGLIRITRNGTSYSNTSAYPFTILGQPSLTVANPCQGYAQLGWDSIPSASSYDIMELIGDSMKKVANTTDTSYLLGNLNRDSSYWLAVRAVNGSNAGRRSLAANILPAGGTCALSSLDNDYTVDSLAGPLSGRLFTSSQLGNSTPIRVELKNLGTIPSGSPFNISYQVNGGGVVTESSNAVIAPNSAFPYTFTATYDFSAAGVYTLQVWVNYPGDPQSGNDTLTVLIKQLQNSPLSLSPSYTEGFETAAPGSYTSPTLGFTGLDRCDFNAGNSNGRVRTFINTGFARTGSRCATLDQIHLSNLSTTDSLVTTFNLSAYSASDQIWLDFYYQNQGIDFTLPGNKVWIRGNDQAAWVPVYTLDTSIAHIGTYQPSTHIDITGTLKGASPVQSVSSSFQIKFGEEGFTSTNSVIPDGDLDDGYSFDDITLSRSTNDLALDSLAGPALAGICNLSNAETIAVKVKNYSSVAASNVPVTYSINGVTVTESIPAINAFDSVIYSFTHTADLSAYQTYTLTAWVSYPGDTYHSNDTLLPVSFQTSPVISTFPYLEGFEAGAGNWYTGGINSSWQWGAPAKTIINKAANGAKCWVTSLTGDYNNNELSYLYSPCFDLSSLASPVLSFSHIFQTEDDCDCDYHWVEYSTDGLNWIKLGAVGNGTNWYDNTTRQAWQLSDTKWHVSSYSIPANAPKIRFRIVMNSDPATTYEGVGIDDIHIFDKAPVYTGANIGGGLAQPVSGGNWVNFDIGGERIVSLNANGQDLGNTNVKVFLHTGPVRNNGTNYYLDRNIVIQPANPPSGSVSVRYYFLDSEANALSVATGCPVCTTIPDAYQSGVTQYSSPVSVEEDSTLANDTSGTFHFLRPHQDVSIIPYDNGYYAEYQVAGFSEFWISGAALGLNHPLPPDLLSFTAIKSANTALLQWNITAPVYTSQFVIEKSKDSIVFSDIDSVSAQTYSGSPGNYQYTDNNLFSGISYYRLKIEDLSGYITYSPVRSVHNAGSGLEVILYPNPVHGGNLYVSSSANCDRIQLVDVSGRTILQMDVHGFLNTVPMDAIAKGIYLVIVDTDAGRQVQKVFVK
jgi:Subtilase family/Secretion system C-terminal sorting domain